MYSKIQVKDVIKVKLLLPFFAFLFFLIVIPSHSYAQQDTAVTPTPTPIDYQLPFPGILPDNPLYKLKTLRDKIIGFLISDPLKKAEFDLFQADKRLSTGWYLLQKNPKDTANIGMTISKGENYFFDSLSQVELAKKQGRDPSLLLHKMLLSSQKHLEIIAQMEKATTGQLSQSLKNDEKRVSDFEKRVYDSINKK